MVRIRCLRGGMCNAPVSVAAPSAEESTQPSTRHYCREAMTRRSFVKHRESNDDGCRVRVRTTSDDMTRWEEARSQSVRFEWKAESQLREVRLVNGAARVGDPLPAAVAAVKVEDRIEAVDISMLDVRIGRRRFDQSRCRFRLS